MNWKNIVKERGIDATIINLSKLEGRIDPEYFSLDILHLMDNLAKKETASLSEFCSITASAFYPAATELYCIGETPFARCVDCINYPVITKNQDAIFERIPENFISKYKNIKTLGEGDIIITKVGTPCYASIVSGYKKIALSRTVLGLKGIKNIDPYYLLAFLRSKYGFSQLQRERELTIQYQLTLERTGKIKIAKPSKALQDKISGIIKQFSVASQKSAENYSFAEKDLLKEINLADYKPSEKNTSVRNYKDCLINDRFDADYWQPKYDKIEKLVSAIPQKELGDIVSMKKGVETGSEAYSEEGKPFIRVSDFTIYGIGEYEKRISEKLYEELKDNYKPSKGEVLFTKDGTIGISFALHEDIDGILSGAFLRLKPKTKINTDYLALVLNSFYCKAQIERMSGGAIIAHLKPDNAKKIKIPMLSDKKQEELASKVITSLRLRNEAKELLEKAKKAVEIFVEKDEKEAIKYLNQK